MQRVDYSSMADKQRKYVALTIPAMFAAANSAPNLSFLGNSPALIHDAVRALRYLPENCSCDEIRNVADTIAQGGDCDDWAPVLLAAYRQLGLPSRLVTAGSSDDNFEHVYVEVFYDGQWIPSDPKGSQRGRDFGVRVPFAVTRLWENGRELLSGSGGDCNCLSCAVPAKGSGAVAGDYLPRSARQILGGIWQAARAQRDENGALVWENIPAALAAQINAAPAVQYTGPGAQLQPGAAQTITAPAVLPVVKVDDDKFVAAWLAAQLPVEQLQLVGRALGLAGDENALRAGVADFFILLARANNTTLRAGAAQNGLVLPDQNDAADYVAPAGYSSGPNPAMPYKGSGALIDFDKLGEKITGAYQQAQVIVRQVQTGVGVALQQVGRSVLKLEQKAPWFGTFISRPLGFHLQATALEQLGNAIRDGSINTFDEKILARATADTFSSAGKALLIAAPLIPQPWGALAGILGAVSVAAGRVLDGAIDAREQQRALARDPNYGAVIEYVDQYGRRVDAQGNLLDPIAAQLEGLRQSQQNVQSGADGWSYRNADFGESGIWYTAFDAQGKPRAVWDGRQWLALG